MSIALAANNDLITESVYGNRFLFQGREYDYDTALYYFRARWYEPETGRWLSPDPIGISGGLNLYAFCGNDPVNFVDPEGESFVSKLIVIGTKKILRTKTARKMIQKAVKQKNGQNFITVGMSKSEEKRFMKKTFPGKEIQYHNSDQTAKKFGDHFQLSPNPGKVHIFIGENYRKLAGMLTVSNYTDNQCIGNTLDLINPLSTPQDVIDLIDVISEAINEGDVIMEEKEF